MSAARALPISELLLLRAVVVVLLVPLTATARRRGAIPEASSSLDDARRISTVGE